MTVDRNWVAHPWQQYERGNQQGLPKYTRGPWTVPGWIDDGGPERYRSQACVITGYCGSGKHDQCAYAVGLTPPSHEYETCDKAHHAICRCDCHYRPEPTRTEPEPEPEQLALL